MNLKGFWQTPCSPRTGFGADCKACFARSSDHFGWGNRVQPYRVAHLLRLNTSEISPAAKHIFIRRAFTCYQMLALLEDIPALCQPHLVRDFLAALLDENIRLTEATRLLEICLRQLDRLCEFAPVHRHRDFKLKLSLNQNKLFKTAESFETLRSLF